MTRFSCLLVIVAACATDGAPPTAPSNLTASALAGGAHVSWKDNSTDEDEFVIMRQQMGTDAAMKELARVPRNNTSFHDEPLVSGATYLYQVDASNANGETASNTVMFTAP